MFSCVCAVYPQDAGSLGHILRCAGLIAVLEKDGSVVINILHLDKYSGGSCSPAARWTVVYVQKQTHQLQSVIKFKFKG